MTDRDKLQHFATMIARTGPDRIVVDDTGFAVSPRRAKRDYGRTHIDVIFIRSDGWSLGASREFEALAEGAWRDHWIGVLRPPATIAEPYPPIRQG